MKTLPNTDTHLLQTTLHNESTNEFKFKCDTELCNMPDFSNKFGQVKQKSY